MRTSAKARARSSRNSARRVCLAATLALLAACSSSPPVDPVAGATSERAYGSSSPRTRAPRASREPKAAPAPTGFAVTVLDADGRARPGVPIVYRGTRNGSGTTGRRGVLRVEVPPGRYRLEVPAGCADRVEVFRGARIAELGVADGSITRASVEVDLRRRYDAGTPVTWTPEAPWATGTTVAFTYQLYDRCTDRPAPDVSFGYLRYRASAGLEIVDAPRRSDGEGLVRISFRCTRPGDPTLHLLDPHAKGDATDLLSLRPQFDPTRSWCA